MCKVSMLTIAGNDYRPSSDYDDNFIIFTDVFFLVSRATTTPRVRT